MDMGSLFVFQLKFSPFFNFLLNFLLVSFISFFFSPIAHFKTSFDMASFIGGKLIFFANSAIELFWPFSSKFPTFSDFIHASTSFIGNLFQPFFLVIVSLHVISQTRRLLADFVNFLLIEINHRVNFFTWINRPKAYRLATQRSGFWGWDVFFWILASHWLRRKELDQFL